MTSKLTDFNTRNILINDVVLTENGNWLVLYDNNGVSFSGTPNDLNKKIKEISSSEKIIISITFNDKGEWIIISSDDYTAYNSATMKWLKENEEQYGKLKAAHYSNSGLAAVFERGSNFIGDVPQNLKNKFKDTKLDILRIKFLNDGSFFLADKIGNFSYAY